MSTLVWQFVALFAGTVVLFGTLSAAMSLLTRFIGAERLRRWVGGSAFAGSAKGLVFGVITPFCSWSTIPVLMSLLRSRVRTAAVAAFLLASPVLDPVLIVAIGWLFGWWVALSFTCFLTVAILIAAFLAERLHLERLVLAYALTPTGGTRVPDGYADNPAEPAWRTWRPETVDAARFAVTQVRQLLLPLAATCALGVAIAGSAPERLLTELAGPAQLLAIPVAALLGAPLYLPTEALAPLGWAMRDAGVALGPTFAFLITAASLSLPELVPLTRVFRMRLIVALVATITTIAVVGALLVPLAA